MAKSIKFNIDSESIMYISISSSKSGYNYASVVAKLGEENYMNVSYEWKDSDVVPDFAMEVMAILQTKRTVASKEVSGVVPGFEEEFNAWVSRQFE